MSNSLPTRSYYPALDGIRGLAILLVVLHHNFYFFSLSHFGWVGVDLFFVLSGFLITNILLSTLGDTHYLRNFYLRRALRIFPLYYGSLILLLLVAPFLLGGPESLKYYVRNQQWLWAFLQNWLYIFYPPPGNGVLNHYWSLAVEEQFYLLWPFVISVLKKPRRLLLFLCGLLVLVLLLRLYVWINQTPVSHFNLYTFSRIDGICIGCIVALIRRTNPGFLSKTTTWIVLGFAGLNFLFDFINERYAFSFPYLPLVGYPTFAMLFGLLVHEATNGRGWIERIFTNSFLRFFGRISFGLYIFHWPIFATFKSHLFTWWMRVSGWYADFVSSLLPTLAAIALSLISYYCFELHFLRLKKRFAN